MTDIEKAILWVNKLAGFPQEFMYRNTILQALQALKEKQQQEINKPLTILDLKRKWKLGEVVWIVWNDDEKTTEQAFVKVFVDYCDVYTKDEIIEEVNISFVCTNEWKGFMAYEFKPKE